MNRNPSKTINLALQGGGSHGAFTWGVLSRLLEDSRLDFNGISGVSSGAMNTCAMLTGLLHGGRDGAKQSLTAFWQAVSAKYSEIFEMNSGNLWEKVVGMDYNPSLDTYLTLTQAFSPYQLNPFDLNPLRDILEEQIDFEILQRDCPIHLYIGATQVRTGKMRLFTNKEITTDVLLASACLPSLHHAIEIDGEPYWDGGYSGNPPLFPLIFESEHPDILVVLLQPLLREAIPKTAEEIRNRSHELMFTNTFLREMRAIALSKQEIKLDWIRSGNLEKRMDRLRIHMIEDQSFETIKSKTRYSVTSNLIDDLYERGYDSAKKWLTKNFRHINKQSSVDLVKMFT